MWMCCIIITRCIICKDKGKKQKVQICWIKNFNFAGVCDAIGLFDSTIGKSDMNHGLVRRPGHQHRKNVNKLLRTWFPHPGAHTARCRPELSPRPHPPTQKWRGLGMGQDWEVRPLTLRVTEDLVGTLGMEKEPSCSGGCRRYGAAGVKTLTQGTRPC